ncbi:MAG: thioredoxin domain-containing protein [Candidatus Paceibacterota bacterium]
MGSNKENAYGIIGAILVSALLIGGAFFITRGAASDALNLAPPHGALTQQGDFRMPSEADHIRGNPEAPLSIVEFSDLECPFCARLHPTLTRIVEENEDVKWIYRHFPLTTIHSRALSGAVASECIARLAGNDSFWTFVDRTFQSQQQLGDAWQIEMASSFGINREAFEDCTSERSIVSLIQEDLNEATRFGGRGTPYVVVVAQSGQLIPFSGALTYEQISGILEQARNN